MSCEIIQINEKTWRIEDDGVRLFLLAGTEKALLIDSGMNLNSAREIASGLTGLPLSLLNTHADRDHIGSNEQFDEIWPSHADIPISPVVIQRLYDGAQAVLDGAIQGKPVALFGRSIVAYDLGFSVLLCDQ